MYSENSGQLRDHLGALMQVSRNGFGFDSLSASDVELLSSFRTSITIWCQQAVAASNPEGNLGGRTPRTRGPAEELRFRLDQARDVYTAPLPSLDQLITPHPHFVVDLWRQSAKAAALGEHDFPAGVTYGHLTETQAMTVLTDAAETTRALVALDRRYTKQLHDWPPIEEAELLGRAAVVCAAHAGYTEPDYSVDRRGWLPQVRPITGPAMPGLDGVLQAETNLLVHLRHQPDAYSLRLIFDSQRIVSHHAAALCAADSGSTGMAEKWNQRAVTYELLVDQSRNLRGLVGTGAAAGQGAIAASRIQALDRSASPQPPQVRHLDSLFGHIDRRIAQTIAAGADDRSYLMRVGMPRVDLNAGGAIKGQRVRHIPLDVPQRARLLDTAKRKLMPTPAAPTSPASAAPSRAAFTQRLLHESPGHGGATSNARLSM